MSDLPALPPGKSIRDNRLHKVVLMRGDYLELRTGVRLDDYVYRGPLLRSEPALIRFEGIAYIDWEIDERVCVLKDKNFRTIGEIPFKVIE
jgi:hypothetical protein